MNIKKDIKLGIMWTFEIRKKYRIEHDAKPKFYSFLHLEIMQTKDYDILEEDYN